MHLYLVRHGQSEGNVIRTFHGQTDYPLTEQGRRQAQEVAEKLRGVSFARCLSSDLRRAWDTALICLEGRNLRPEKCPALREQFVGEMEGVTWEELGVRFPGLRERYVENWLQVEPPGGETPAGLEARVGSCVDEVIAKGEDALLVAHNGSLSLLLKHLGLADTETLSEPQWYFRQGCYSVIRVDGQGVHLECFNR